MNLSFIWEALVLIIAGIFLLRMSGRKSIAQMTLPQTILMISIGTIIVQPIVEKSLLKAIGAAAVFALTIVVIEYLQQKFNGFEKFVTGKSKIVIEEGGLNVQNLKKLRMTVDQLEMRLRNQGISKIEDVKTATIEPNGLLGYELMDDAKPLTMKDFKQLMNSYLEKNNNLNESISSIDKSNQQDSRNTSSIFEEINSQQKPNHNHLQ